VTPSSKYSGAEVSCKNAGGHVVTFASEAEFGRVLQWSPSASAVAFWVGLNYDNNGGNAYIATGGGVEPGWAERCTGCYAHLDAGAPFFPKPPNALDGGPNRACVFARPPISDPWFYADCDLGLIKLPVVCEREPVGTTAQGCIGATCLSVRGKGSYLYLEPAATAQQAFANCQDLGAKPVVFETREEREALARDLLSFLPANSVPKIWIGLSHKNADAGWVWADDSPAQAYPLEWAASQPALGQWAYIQFTGQFDTQLATSADGTARYPYICEFD
jgi:Lectin C-type domain